MSGDTLISVVVPVWNGDRFLGKCIESIRAQDHALLEIIVVDDGSTDRSAEVAASYDGVRVLRRPHEGLAATRNAGVAAASADLIAFCDSDDGWKPHKASTQLAHLLANPECDIALSRMEHTFEEGAEWPAWLRPDQVRGDLDGVAPCSGLFRRSVFDRVEGFRPDLGKGADFDLLIQARTAGCRVDVVEEILHTRRIHGTNDMSTGEQLGTGPMFQSVRDHLRHRRSSG